MLGAVGFTGDALKIAAAVGFGESQGYTDAVGDLHQLDDPDPKNPGHLVGEKWGPSIGWFQIRTLRKPLTYPFPDTLRIAQILLDPFENARVAFEISKKGTDWSKWSVFRSGTYLKHMGTDYELKTGHERADLWDS